MEHVIAMCSIEIFNEKHTAPCSGRDYTRVWSITSAVKIRSVCTCRAPRGDEAGEDDDSHVDTDDSYDSDDG